MSCAAGKEALLLSEKRIMTLEMLPKEYLVHTMEELGHWVCGMDGIGAGLSAVLHGAYLFDSLPMLFKG